MALHERGMRRNPLASANIFGRVFIAVLAFFWTFNVAADVFGSRVSVFARHRAFTTVESSHPLFSKKRDLFFRGGASRATVDLESDDEESTEEEDVGAEEDKDLEITEQIVNHDDLDDMEDEEIHADPKLTAAAIKSSVKVKTTHRSAKISKSKEAVNAKLASTSRNTETVKSVRNEKRSRSLFTLPYIVRACLNPFTAFVMAKAYWVSLFDLDYPPKVPAEGLRSSMEQKNAKSGGSGFTKPKKKMKRGQAKTLSDLPQLST